LLIKLENRIFMKPLERQAVRDYNADMKHDIDSANAQRE
jgi:hypothetical protein